MTRTDRPNNADSYSRIVLHRDGTVTMWSCARQQWERGTPDAADLAECSGTDSARVARHVERCA
jgi:hypothetical protein